MSFATGFEGLAMLLPWLREDRDRRSARPADERSPWFRWGYMTEGGVATGWYILIALPSYGMDRSMNALINEGEPTLHQRHLLFKERLPAGPGGWEVIMIECVP